MTKKITLCVAILAVILTTACSRESETETSEPMEEGSFTGDPDTKIKSKDNKFLCDFQFTDGPKRWNYDASSGDTPVTEKEKAKEPWCLIPYGDSTEFSVTTKSEKGVENYICRDLNAQYSLRNEEIINTNSSLDGGGYEIEYETHQQMMCVPINSVIVTAKNPSAEFTNEKLYRVRKIENLYSIEGHANLQLVKPVHLSILWEPILSKNLLETNISTEKINNIKNDWKAYMKKVGYYIDIKTLPVVFPNSKSSLKNRKRSTMILAEDERVLAFPDAIDWYNMSKSEYPKLLDFFKDENISAYNSFDYMFTTTEGYSLNNTAAKKGFAKMPGDLPNLCLLSSVVFLNLENLMITSSIVRSNSGLCYDINGKELSVTWEEERYNEYRTCWIEKSEDCSKSYYYETRFWAPVDEKNTIGSNYLTTEKGSVMSDSEFFNSKNAGRLMAALTYSKIIDKMPIGDSDSDKRWLSYYADDPIVEQPKKYWREEPTQKQQQKLREQLKEFIPILEFASIMQN